jgi:LysM repeat protein
MVLRDEEGAAIPAPPKSHTVQMGETLYSISRQYGCSVEQLKEWNPQMGDVLRAGEKLRIFIP